MNVCEAGERNTQEGLAETLPGAHTEVRIAPLPSARLENPLILRALGRVLQGACLSSGDNSPDAKHGLPGWPGVRHPPACAGAVDSVLGSGRSPGEGNGNPLQYFCLGNPTHRRSLVSYSPWGPKSIGHNLATKQQQQVFHCI